MAHKSGYEEKGRLRKWIPKLRFIRYSLYRSSQEMSMMLDDALCHSVIMLDGGIETLMIVTLNYLCETRKEIKGRGCCKISPEIRFRDIANMLDNALGDLYPDIRVPQTELNELHKLRNLAQHNARPPSQRQIEQLAQSLKESFIEPLAKTVFDVELEAVSMSELIKNEEVKKFYASAELAFEKKEYKRSLVSSIGALYIAAYMEAKYRIGGQYSDKLSVSLPYTDNREAFTHEVGRQLTDLSDKLEKVVTTFKLGLDFKVFQISQLIFQNRLPLDSVGEYLNLDWENFGSKDVEDIMTVKDQKFMKFLLDNFDSRFEEDCNNLAKLFLDYSIENILRWEDLPIESYLRFYGLNPWNLLRFIHEE